MQTTINTSNIYKERKLFLVALLLPLVLSITPDYSWIILPLILISASIYFLSRKFIAPLLILSLLVITSDISENIRILVNISGFFLLVSLFIRNFGFDVKEYPRVPFLISLLILFFVTSLFLSGIQSTELLISFKEILRQILFFVLLYIFYSLCQVWTDLPKFYIAALIGSGSLIAITIIYSFFFLQKSINLLSVQEGGYFKNVAAAGGIFIAGVSLCISLLSLKVQRNKMILITAIIIQVFGLILTSSRAAYLGLFASIIFILFILNKKLLFRILFFSVIFLIVLIIFFPSTTDFLFLFLRGGRIFSNTRYHLWPIAIDIIQDNPIFGVGPGMFKFYIYKYLPVMIGSWDEQQIRWIYENAGSGHAHNFVLFLTSELGLAGLISAISLPILFFYFLKKTIKYFKRTEHYPIIVGIGGLGFGLFIRSFFEATGLLTYGWITRDLPFWVAFSIIIHFYQKANGGTSKISETASCEQT